MVEIDLIKEGLKKLFNHYKAYYETIKDIFRKLCNSAKDSYLKQTGNVTYPSVKFVTTPKRLSSNRSWFFNAYDRRWRHSEKC